MNPLVRRDLALFLAISSPCQHYSDLGTLANATGGVACREGLTLSPLRIEQALQ
jgi:hypothetical protein